MTSLGADTRRLLQQTHEAYLGTDHEEEVENLLERFDEPLRVAIAGKVKAGKSTLLNALVGARVAATDATECTRLVTWYQDGLVYDVAVHDKSGQSTRGAITVENDQATIDLGANAPEHIERLLVTWPSQELLSKTLIDSPGIGSLSRDVSAVSVDFLSPEDEETPADAVLYLMKHLHGEDIELLRSFHDVEVSQANPINAIGVLSRADEIGAGRADAMDSAHRVASRMSSDPVIRQLVQTVIPVAGLLGETAATLTEAEFQAIRSLAELAPTEVDLLLLSTDRFTSEEADAVLSPEQRQNLLDRFAIFGIRTATSAIRSGRVSTAKELSDELVAVSGLGRLRQILETLFVDRRFVLKSRSALLALQALYSSSPAPDGDALAAELERIIVSDHSIEELRTLSAVRGGWVTGKPEVLAELERLLGSEGQSAQARLDLGPYDDAVTIRAAALDTISRWRRRADNPISSSQMAAASHVAIRSCEGIVAEIEDKK